MIVVADASPLIVLAKIELTRVLPALFGQVLIPPQIKAELLGKGASAAVLELASTSDVWLVERTPAQLLVLPRLDPGEVAAISLAVELKADFLLIDELRGRREAIHRGLKITGTLGILTQAAERQMIDLADAFQRIRQTDFRVSDDLLNSILALHNSTRGSTP